MESVFVFYSIGVEFLSRLPAVIVEGSTSMFLLFNWDTCDSLAG